MAVWLTQALRQALIDSGADPKDLIEAFEAWRVNWPANEYGSRYFGKDGAYERPLVDGEYVLRHVHLVPILDTNALERWWQKFRHASRKSSDRHLVYCQDRRGSFLLIYILTEQTAHQVALMKTPDDKALMLRFAEVAKTFRTDGSIIG